MKKTIPFAKQIHFKTVIAEITDIEVTHNLIVKEDNVIEGDIIVDGTYKMHEASQIEEEFNYSLPFTIEVDNKYDIEHAEIGISDFYFEIINEEDLKVNIELEIRNVEEKVEEELLEDVVREYVEEVPIEINEQIESIEVPSADELESDYDYMNNDYKEENNNYQPNYNSYETPMLENDKEQINNESSLENNSYPNIFDSISSDETYVTYYVYIVRESDTIDSIIDKYKVTREDLSLYNDLDNIKVGSKIIIPCHNE